jgi:hypothetical protein
MTYQEMLIYREGGSLPKMNEEFVIHPAYEDNGPALEIITHREFNIEDQNYFEFWANIRTEYWSDLALMELFNRSAEIN